jgi:hypothetical protein
VIDDWTDALDKGLTIETVYMDFQKAFDTVPHKRLMTKLEAHGIKDPILGWINSFLTERSQYVTVNGATSKSKPVLSGVPQGSVLGPILFVIYINDLPDNIKSNIFLFVDDTKLYNTIGNEKDREQLQKDLDQLQKWSNKWLLKFHPDKCKYMTVGNYTTENEGYHLYKDDGSKHYLEETNKEKDIGVTFDSKLTFEDHIIEKIKKANSMVGIIRRTFKYITPEIFSYLYKTLVRCHLDYAASVWSPQSVKLSDQIESVQRRATKTIPGFKDLTYEQRLIKLNLPTLKYRRIRGDMIETFKIVRGIYDPEVTLELPMEKDSQNRPTRGHKYKIHKIGATKTIRQKSFTQRLVNPWNSLPDNIVEAPSLNAFKNRLDKYWKHQEVVTNYKAELDTRNNTKHGRTIDVDIEVQ